MACRHIYRRQAEQAIQDVLLNSDAESAELVQDGTVVAEYSEEEFGV